RRGSSHGGRELRLWVFDAELLLRISKGLFERPSTSERRDNLRGGKVEIGAEEITRLVDPEWIARDDVSDQAARQAAVRHAFEGGDLHGHHLTVKLDANFLECLGMCCGPLLGALQTLSFDPSTSARSRTWRRRQRIQRGIGTPAHHETNVIHLREHALKDRAASVEVIGENAKAKRRESAGNHHEHLRGELKLRRAHSVGQRPRILLRWAGYNFSANHLAIGLSDASSLRELLAPPMMSSALIRGSIGSPAAARSLE